MNSESSVPIKSRNAKYIQFFLILVAALVIGLVIRHYTSKSHESIGGTWEVYFSDVYSGELEPDTPNTLDKRLIEKLAAAKTQIDGAIYHLKSTPVATALINAHNRGVKVRIYTENKYAKEDEIKRLYSAGIDVRNDGDNDGYMHHKFFVIDERYVWTGSYNTTYNGAYKNNNNVLWFDSDRLASNFSKEFHNIYFSEEKGNISDGTVPYPQVELSDGTKIFTYFSPENDTISPILQEINSAAKSIQFMAFSFTHDSIGNAMRGQFQNGILVDGIFEEKQVNNMGSEYESLVNNGIRVIVDQSEGTMHHKVIIIDEERVITGSYNFSKNAEKRNSENLLIIKGNKKLAQAYLNEYNRVKGSISQ